MKNYRCFTALPHEVCTTVDRHWEP